MANLDLLRHSRAICSARARSRRAEDRRIEHIKSEARAQGYRVGYDTRDAEFTKLIDAGSCDAVWLTPKPVHDVLHVAPPQKLPLRLDLQREYYRSIPQRPMIFLPRVIAECYDGVQYRQVLWERAR